jgi:hypothetical protein
MMTHTNSSTLTKTYSSYHLIYHKSYMDLIGIELGLCSLWAMTWSSYFVYLCGTTSAFLNYQHQHYDQWFGMFIYKLFLLSIILFKMHHSKKSLSFLVKTSVILMVSTLIIHSFINTKYNAGCSLGHEIYERVIT